MFSDVNERIDQALAIINQKKIINLGRAGNMMWLHFAVSPDTSNQAVYALDIQGTFRVCDNKEIIFGSYDMYTENSSTEWSEDFQWDVQGANLFDELSEMWLKKVLENEIYVSSFQSNSYGDLKILLSNGDRIEIFVNNASAEEVWRFFKMEDLESHFVVTGQGIED